MNIEYSELVSLFPGVTDLKAGAVGLALSYAVTLVGMFQWGVRQSAEVENMVKTSFIDLDLNSAKKDMSYHCQLRLFSAHLTYIYLYEHKIQQLRQTEEVPQTCD